MLNTGGQWGDTFTIRNCTDSNRTAYIRGDKGGANQDRQWIIGWTYGYECCGITDCTTDDGCCYVTWNTYVGGLAVTSGDDYGQFYCIYDGTCYDPANSKVSSTLGTHKPSRISYRWWGC